MEPEPRSPIEATDITNAVGGLRQDDIIIALGILLTVATDSAIFIALIFRFLGSTGSGKSYFIDLLTEQKGRRASDKLKSKGDNSVQVTRVKHPIYGDRVVLVDTPGFDDTTRSDMQILQIIGDWMAKTYENYVKLSGIVYLHRITDNRMGGSQYRNLRMFGDLVGDVAMKKVILVSTMWEKVNPEMGKRREQELQETFWKAMIDKGSRTYRLENSTSTGAWGVVEELIKEHEKREAFLLQEEIVNLGRQLNETEAGKKLYSPLQKLLAEQREFLKALFGQPGRPSDPRFTEHLEKEKTEIEKQFQKTFDEVRDLKIPLGRRILLLFLGTKKRAGRA